MFGKNQAPPFPPMPYGAQVGSTIYHSKNNSDLPAAF